MRQQIRVLGHVGALPDSFVLKVPGAILYFNNRLVASHLESAGRVILRAVMDQGRGDEILGGCLQRSMTIFCSGATTTVKHDHPSALPQELDAVSRHRVAHLCEGSNGARQRESNLGRPPSCDRD